MLAIGLIVVINAVTMAVGYFTFELVNREESILTEEIVPSLIEFQNIAADADVAANLLLLQRAERREEVEERFHAARAISDSLFATLRRMENLGIPADLIEPLRNEISPLIELCSSSAREVREKIGLQETLRTKSDALAEKIEDLIAQMDPMVLDYQDHARTVGESISTSSSIQASDTSDTQVLALLRLQFALTSVKSLVQGILTLDQPGGVDRANQQFQLEMRDISRGLAVLTSRDEQTQIAVGIDDCLSRWGGPGQLLETAARISSLRELTHERYALARQAEQRIDQLIQELGADGRHRSRTAASRIRSAFASSRRLWIGLLIISLVAAAAVIVLYVHRNIVRRLDELAANVRRLGRGELDQPVAVEGADELSQIGNALEELRTKTRDLRDLQTSLAHRNEELYQFVNVASHDLKSPLRAIRNLTSWTVEDDGAQLSTTTLTNLETIHQRADGMDRLLNDLLEYAKIGEGELTASKMNFGDIVDRLLELIDVPSRFEVRVECDPAEVTASKFHLELVLRNLISNAFEHHDRDRGRICVDMSVQEDRKTMQITVSDDGPGIPPSRHATAFSFFRRFSTKQSHGTGMGLALVRKAVAEVGGKIAIDSDGQRGCRFVITWPLEEVTPTVHALS